MGSISITDKSACSNSISFHWQGSVSGVDYARKAYNQGVVYKVNISGDTCNDVFLHVSFLASSTGYDSTVAAYLYTFDPTSSGNKQPVSGYSSSASLVAHLSTSGNLSESDRMCHFSFYGVNLSPGTYYIWCCEIGGSPYQTQIYTNGSGYALNPVYITGNFTPTPPPVTYYSVTVAKGTGIASVSGESSYYQYGDTCILSCTVSPGYIFDGWYQGGNKLSGSPSIQFTVYGNYNFEAKATPGYIINVGYDQETIASVSGGGTYAAGTSVTVTAELLPDDDDYHYEFVGWQETGQIVSTSLSYSFIVSSLRSLFAYGRKIQKSKGGVWIFSDDDFQHYSGTVNIEGSNIKVIPWIYHNSEWRKTE